MKPETRRRVAEGAAVWLLYRHEDKRRFRREQAERDRVIRATNPAAWEQIQQEREIEAALEADHTTFGGTLGIFLLAVVVIVAIGVATSLSKSTAVSTTALVPVSVEAPAPDSVSARAPAPPMLVPMNEVRPVFADAPLRESPDDSSDVVEQIHAGQRVRIVGVQGDYFEIRKLNGVIGFAPRESIGG
jgi:hypothetical protein